MSKVCIIAWIHGLVQGVGFRYSTQSKARQLSITGYVRNLDDASVEVVACGDSGQVEELVTWLNAGGPRSARVDRVVKQSYQPEKAWRDFVIRY